ncbi:MAG: hypothetical protein E7677_02315 [Ruminococcaceae bacterium]|nr:hypothetical protein [Oscillospiraceae bacterium]
MSKLKKIAALLICLTMIIGVFSSCDEISQSLRDVQDKQMLQEDDYFEKDTDTKKDISTKKPESSTSNNNSTPKPDSTTNTEKVEMVWVPASGTKYHSKSTCSGMNSPRNIPLEDAIKEGYTACKRCH